MHGIVLGYGTGVWYGPEGTRDWLELTGFVPSIC